MNFSNPILICDENEDFRILITDMLTKNGFFHILEATSSSEIIEILNKKIDLFILIEAKALTLQIISLLERQRNYIIFAENKDASTLNLAAKLGVNHIMSYPFNSRKLIEKINSLL